MKRSVSFFSLIVAMLLIASLDAQTRPRTRPDFTGQWTMFSPDPAAARARPDINLTAGGWGFNISIAHKGDELRVTLPPRSQGQAVEQVYAVKWSGPDFDAVLVRTGIKADAADMPVATLSLDDSGNLVVTTRWVKPEPGQPATTTVKYRKN